MTSPTSDAPPPAASTNEEPPMFTSDEPPIVEVNADPMMGQVVYYDRDPGVMITFGSDDDH